jgi:hypothetical protein
MSYDSQASFFVRTCLPLQTVHTAKGLSEIVIHGMHVRRRVFLGKRLHNGYGETLLSLTTQVSLLTCVVRLGGATIHTARERTVHHTAVST